MKSTTTLLIVTFGLMVTARPQSPAAPGDTSSNPVEFCDNRVRNSDARPACLVAADECASSNNGVVEYNCWNDKMRDVDTRKPYKKQQDKFEEWVNEKCADDANDEARLQQCREATEDCSKTTSHPWASNAKWNRIESCYKDALAKTEGRTERQAKDAFLVYRSKRQCKQRVGEASDKYGRCTSAFQGCSIEDPNNGGRWGFQHDCYLECMAGRCPPKKSAGTRPQDETRPEEDANATAGNAPRPDDSDNTNPEAGTGLEENATADPKDDRKAFGQTKCKAQFANDPSEQRLCVRVVAQCLSSERGKAGILESDCYQHYSQFHRASHKQHEERARTYCQNAQLPSRVRIQEQDCVTIYMEGFQAAQHKQE